MKVSIFLGICLYGFLFCGGRVAAAMRPNRTETQAVMAQVLNIVASSFEIAAHPHDKEEQLHALAGIVSSISSIVQLASRSNADAEVVIATLDQIKAYQLREYIEKMKERLSAPRA